MVCSYCPQEEDQRDTNDTSSGTDQHLASMFLKPTSSDASLAGDSAWSMEQSTFNLGDLCPAGPGSGQVSYSQVSNSQAYCKLCTGILLKKHRNIVICGKKIRKSSVLHTAYMK